MARTRPGTICWSTSRQNNAGMRDQGYDSFLEPKKESKKAACDAKVKLIKLEGGTAAPRGREKLESLGLE